MPVPPVRPLLVVRPPLPGADAERGDDPAATTTCRRCRRTFARHPSLCAVDSPTRWLCPACDHGRARRAAPAALRIVGSAPGAAPGPLPVAPERSR